jgi:predicted NAD-dependent protein-ADP-ribosyltransferase YbiA (DUF1768 family)
LSQQHLFGNDVLHDEWREVTGEEYEAAHHYVQRIVEDFYDPRAEVEATLIKSGRLPNALSLGRTVRGSVRGQRPKRTDRGRTGVERSAGLAWVSLPDVG